MFLRLCFARSASRSESCNRCSCLLVRSAARRRWTCVEARNSKYLRSKCKKKRCRNERATSGGSAQECVEAERRERARFARAIPRRGSVRREPGFESGLRQNDFSGEDADAAAASLSSRRAGRRLGDRERCGTTGAQQSSGEADHDRDALPSGSGDGAECAAGVGSASTGFPVYRERGEPGLSILL